MADLNPGLIAAAVLNVVCDRVYRDARRMGLIVRTAEPGQDEKLALATALGFSEVSRSAHALAEWATSTRGQAAEIPALLRQVHADLDGIDVKKASTRGPVDLATSPGVALDRGRGSARAFRGAHRVGGGAGDARQPR